MGRAEREDRVSSLQGPGQCLLTRPDAKNHHEARNTVPTSWYAARHTHTRENPPTASRLKHKRNQQQQTKLLQPNSSIERNQIHGGILPRTAQQASEKAEIRAPKNTQYFKL